MRDVLTDSINAPAGRLTEILLKRIVKGEDGRELPSDMQARFDELASAQGEFGKLARVRLAAEVSVLFEQAPNWTAERIVPLFDWSSPEAADAWSARRYSSYIGSPRLFTLTKKPFLELFGRLDMGEDELRTFSEWLLVILIANQTSSAQYLLNAQEVRSALRSAGPRVLPTVAHRLAIEMEATKVELKGERWRKVVGPIFNSIWPLDAELQSSSATFGLVQLLIATGNAFSEAAELIVPFIRSEEERHRTSIFRLSQAGDELYASAPETVLEVAAAIVGDAHSKSALGLQKILERLRSHAPRLVETRKFQRLASQAALY